MGDTVSVILSGLTAQGQRFAASANNIANISTVGVLPTAAQPSSTVYKPLNVSYTALMAGGGGDAGGVRATVTEDPKGYTAIFDPTSVYANNEGVIAAPNVDLVKEMVNIMEAKILFKAGATMLKAQKEMTHDLLNAIV